MAVTDNAGNVVERVAYEAYGKPVFENIVTGSTASWSAAGNRYSYTGREYESATGLYYYRARWYDAETGRFTQKDPIGFAGGDTNLYAYVYNSPMNFVDPTGLFGLDDLSISQGVVDFSAGFGDVLSGGLTNTIRHELSSCYGLGDNVNIASDKYKYGQWSGYGVEAVTAGAMLAETAGIRLVFYKYPTGGVGMNLLWERLPGITKPERVLGLDWHSFKLGGKLKSYPHVDSKTFRMHHWPWSMK